MKKKKAVDPVAYGQEVWIEHNFGLKTWNYNITLPNRQVTLRH